MKYAYIIAIKQLQARYFVETAPIVFSILWLYCPVRF